MEKAGYICFVWFGFVCLFFFFFHSKVVSVDHNKPIIVPAGQDSFQQIGEKEPSFSYYHGSFYLFI